MGLLYVYVRSSEKCWMAGHVFSDLKVDVSEVFFKIITVRTRFH